TVIITRLAGRTPVPEGEQLRLLAAHKSTMVIFLSAGLLERVREELLLGGYEKDTPCAIVYKASWPEEKTVIGTLEGLVRMAAENQVTKTALIIVGRFFCSSYELSRLYDAGFETGYRSVADVPGKEQITGETG
ncbi:MAG TPA: SAM-dependent methyltransferase, partial [Lachnospiraceae bacterium]|nr:SAM-dependent methyltransferase [Lachnospiraceae bacterium]